MARIAGVDLPNNKQGEIGLTYIFGIGRPSAKRILAKCGIDPTIKVGDWNDDQIAKIRAEINDEYKIEGELRSSVQMVQAASCPLAPRCSMWARRHGTTLRYASIPVPTAASPSMRTRATTTITKRVSTPPSPSRGTTVPAPLPSVSGRVSTRA